MDKVDNKKSKYYRYGEYRDEVAGLKESYGYSSRKIAKIVSEKYPGTPPRLPCSAVRRV